MNSETPTSPLNRLPGVVWLLILTIAAIELVLALGGLGLVGPPEAIGWRIKAMEQFAYSSALQDWMFGAGQFPARHLWRVATFSFVQPQTMGAVLVVVILAALGKYLAEPMGSLRFAVLALVPPSVAAVVFGWIVGPTETGWLVGGMVMVFGLVGAFTWRRWHLATGDPASQRRAFGIIGVLIAARLGFGLFVDTGPGWVAEITAFGLGFALASLIAPGQATTWIGLLRKR